MSEPPEHPDGTVRRPLFALPEYNEAGVRFIVDAVLTLARLHHPVLQQITMQTVDGPVGSQITEDDGEIVDLPGAEASAGIEWSISRTIHGDYDEILACIDREAVKQAGELLVLIVRTISSMSGTPRVATKGPFTWDDIIDALATLDWSFDEDGNHNMGWLGATPNQPMTPAQQARMRALIETKRKEHDAARLDRRLS